MRTIPTAAIGGTGSPKMNLPRSARVPTTSVAMATTSRSQEVTLKVKRLGDELAVIRRVAERHLRRLGALEIEMHVVLPGEADSTVDLDAVPGDLAIGVGYVRLGHRRGERAVRRVGIEIGRASCRARV